MTLPQRTAAAAAVSVWPTSRPSFLSDAFISPPEQNCNTHEPRITFATNDPPTSRTWSFVVDNDQFQERIPSMQQDNLRVLSRKKGCRRHSEKLSQSTIIDEKSVSWAGVIRFSSSKLRQPQILNCVILYRAWVSRNVDEQHPRHCFPVRV